MLAPQLEGLDANGVHDVSDALVDKFAHNMKETQKIKWPAWEGCTSKQADASGVAKEVQGEVKATTQANADYNLHNLFFSRGIAAATVNVMTFKNHQRLTQQLMSDLAAIPPPRLSTCQVYSGTRRRP